MKKDFLNLCFVLRFFFGEEQWESRLRKEKGPWGVSPSNPTGSRVTGTVSPGEVLTSHLHSHASPDGCLQAGVVYPARVPVAIVLQGRCKQEVSGGAVGAIAALPDAAGENVPHDIRDIPGVLWLSEPLSLDVVWVVVLDIADQAVLLPFHQ